MTAKKIAYVEFPAVGAGGVEAMKGFYGQAMGWEFQDWGPDYAAFSGAGVDGGFHGGEGPDRPKGPLVVLETDNLEQTLAQVTAAGGTITLPIFPFPGGRRFHFADPAGNELAVMQQA